MEVDGAAVPLALQVGVHHSSSHRMMADSQAHAREMDAADGKIDGKFFGDKVCR